MPGPRAKQHGTKKNKPKTVHVAVIAPQSPPLPQALQPRALNTLDELSANDWDEVVRVMCNHLNIPGTSIAHAFAAPC